MPKSSSTQEMGEPVVFVIDDDESVRRMVDSLLRSAGYQSRSFPSINEFLETESPDALHCLIADVRLPKISGLDLPSELQRRGRRIPIIFMTGHGDIPMSVRAMKSGAVDFLVKPFRDQDMLDAVAAALMVDQARRETERGLADLRERYNGLTTREREVLARIASGLLNKQVAGELGLSEITVKFHRSTLMRKMGTRSLAQLIRMVEALERDGTHASTPV